MKGLASRGNKLGDMMPSMEDYQVPNGVFAGTEGDTLSYIERHNRAEVKQASDIKKQAFKGRYK